MIIFKETKNMTTKKSKHMTTKKSKPSLREYECFSTIIGGHHSETIYASSKSEARENYIKAIKNEDLVIDESSIEIDEIETT